MSDAPALTPAEVAELRELNEKATPGKWRADGDIAVGGYVETIQVMRCCGQATPSGECCGNGVPDVEPEWVEQAVLAGEPHDIALAVAMRNALPRLLAAAEERERLAARVAGLEAERSQLWASSGTLASLATEARSLANRLTLSTNELHRVLDPPARAALSPVPREDDNG